MAVRARIITGLGVLLAGCAPTSAGGDADSETTQAAEDGSTEQGADDSAEQGSDDSADQGEEDSAGDDTSAGPDLPEETPADWFWTPEAPPPGNQMFPVNLELDGDGDIYAVVEERDPITGGDYSTIRQDLFRISAAGDELWKVQLDVHHRDMCVTPSGTIHVVSAPEAAVGVDPRVVRSYGPDGAFLGEVTVPGFEPYADGDVVDERDRVRIVCDDEGGYYLSHNGEYNGFPWWVSHRDAAGAELWTYDAPESYFYEERRALARSPSGTLFVAGPGSGDYSTDWTVTALSATGDFLWRTEFNGGGDDNHYNPQLVADDEHLWFSYQDMTDNQPYENVYHHYVAVLGHDGELHTQWQGAVWSSSEGHQVIADDGSGRAWAMPPAPSVKMCPHRLSPDASEERYCLATPEVSGPDSNYARAVKHAPSEKLVVAFTQGSSASIGAYSVD